MTEPTRRKRTADSHAKSSRWRLVPELAKARLSAMVVMTGAVGFVLASGAEIEWAQLVWTSIGLAMSAGGANAFNQWMETAPDSRMRRTAGRPLPANRMNRGEAFGWAMGLTVSGTLLIAATSNLLAAAICAATALIYVLAYTPLKSVSPMCTLVGAAVGALPPMIGWAAAAGELGFGAWILGALLFVWQIPHFLSLAWVAREDYERGGFRMLPVVDPRGRFTGTLVLVYSLTLVPVALAAPLAGLAGGLFAAGAAALGVGFAALGWRLFARRTTRNARRVFLASLLYLPLLLTLLIVDRRLPDDTAPAMQVAERIEVRESNR